MTNISVTWIHCYINDWQWWTLLCHGQLCQPCQPSSTIIKHQQPSIAIVNHWQLLTTIFNLFNHSQPSSTIKNPQQPQLTIFNPRQPFFNHNEMMLTIVIHGLLIRPTHMGCQLSQPLYWVHQSMSFSTFHMPISIIISGKWCLSIYINHFINIVIIVNIIWPKFNY